MGMIPNRLDQLAAQVKRKTFVPIVSCVSVGTHVLVTGKSDQDRTGHELERRPATSIPECPPPHKGQRIVLMRLHERLIGRRSYASPINHAK